MKGRWTWNILARSAWASDSVSLTVSATLMQETSRLCLQADLLKYPLQIVVACVFDDNAPPLRRVLQGYTRAEVRGQTLLDVGHCGCFGCRHGTPLPWPAREESRWASASLSSTRTLKASSMIAGPGSRAAQHLPPRAVPWRGRRSKALGEVAQDVGIERKQAEGVGHRGPALAHPLGRLLLGQIKIANQAGRSHTPPRPGSILALQVLDQREGGGRGVARLQDAGGDGLDLERLEGAPAPFAGDELEFLPGFSHDNRLQQASARMLSASSLSCSGLMSFRG